MLIVALVLAVVGLAALVTAVVTSNEVVAWVCIAASLLGVVLLIVDALRERQRRDTGEAGVDSVAYAEGHPEAEELPETAATGDAAVEATYKNFDADYPDDHPDEVVSDDPTADIPDDDEPEYPQAAEEAAVHVVDESATGDEAADGDTDRGSG